MATGRKRYIAARRRASRPSIGSLPSPIPCQELLHVARRVRGNPTMQAKFEELREAGTAPVVPKGDGDGDEGLA